MPTTLWGTAVTKFANHLRLPTKSCQTSTVAFAEVTIPVPVCMPEVTNPTGVSPVVVTGTTISGSPVGPAASINAPLAGNAGSSNNKWLSVGFPILLIAVVFLTRWLVHRFAANKRYDKLYPNRTKSIRGNPPVRETIIYVPVTEPRGVRTKARAEEIATVNSSSKAARTLGTKTIRTVESEGPTVPVAAKTKDCRDTRESVSARGSTSVPFNSNIWG